MKFACFRNFPLIVTHLRGHNPMVTEYRRQFQVRKCVPIIDLYLLLVYGESCLRNFATELRASLSIALVDFSSDWSWWTQQDKFFSSIFQNHSIQSLFSIWDKLLSCSLFHVVTCSPIWGYSQYIHYLRKASKQKKCKTKSKTIV